MEIKGVIFDMDGVLTDSESWAVKCCEETYKEFDVPWDFEFYRRVIGVNETDCIAIMMERFDDLDKCKAALDRFVEKLYEGFENNQIKMKKGAIELITFLNERNFPICLATSAGEGKIKKSFNSNGYEVPFKNFVTGEMVTHSKPNPEIFMIAASKMGLDIHDCLIIEDSYSGMQAAISAGAISCMVPDILQPTEFIKENATFIKKDLLEVQEIIKQYASL